MHCLLLRLPELDIVLKNVLKVPYENNWNKFYPSKNGRHVVWPVPLCTYERQHIWNQWSELRTIGQQLSQCDQQKYYK